MPPKANNNSRAAEPATPRRTSVAEMAGAGAARDLVHTLLVAEDAENSRIARMLHDNVGQNIAVLLLAFKGLERDLEGRPGAELTLQSLHAITQSVGQELHKVALELRPTALDDYGLIRELTTYLKEWALVSKLTVDFDHRAFGERRLPHHLERILFRVIRDALRYIVAGVHAERFSVILKREPERVTAIVENVGKVRMPPASGGGSRLTHLVTLEARVALVGGTTDLESRGDTTTMFVRLPLANPRET